MSIPSDLDRGSPLVWAVARLAHKSRAMVAVAAMAFMGAPAAAQGDLQLDIHTVEVTCPIGGQRFEAPVLGFFQVHAVRLDLKPMGTLIAPWPLPVCPGNGFVVYKHDFTPGEIAKIRRIVRSADYRRLRRSQTDYYMAGYVKEHLGGADDYDLGQTYLQASWEAERERPNLVDSYRALALAKLDAFLGRDSSRSESWWTASLLVIELERMLGHFDAVEARLKSFPFEQAGSYLGSKGTALTSTVDQIRMHALSHNAAPQYFSETVAQPM